MIYEPKGPAREYSELALNYYKGCGNHCKYCYVPGFFKMHGIPVDDKLGVNGSTKHDLKQKVATFLHKLSKYAPRHTAQGRVLLSFTSDPYHILESELKLTRQVIEILGSNNIPITVLTKNPKFALNRDGDLFRKYDVELASTIIFSDDEKRKQWEPDASTIQDRVEAIGKYHHEGRRTWVSVEPIIDADQAFEAIKMLCGMTGLLKIGVIDPRWNPDIYRSIDWPKLLKSILIMLNTAKQPYYIKNGLWRLATNEILSSFDKEMRTVGEFDE